ncbi:MAG: SPASM domain-containing protein [bacterium]
MYRYKSSQFNLFIPIDDSEECLIFNTFTGSEVVVDRHLRALIEIEKNQSSGEPLSPFDESNLDQLKELGILVDEHADEDRELEYWFQKIKFDTSMLAITILPTLACNLKCTYCLQDGLQSDTFMSWETCSLVVAWIKKKMEDIRPATLSILYYGGEPLLNLPAITYLSQSLYEAARAHGIRLDIQIVTNGVLLKREVVDALLPLGLSGVKITLDGDEDAHNLKRPFKDGQGSFQQIFQNLVQIYGRVPVRLGGNFDEHNKGSIPGLLDRLLGAGIRDKLEQVHFKPILTSPACQKKGGSCQVCTFSEANPGDILWLRREIEKRGFKTNDGIHLGPCMVMREHSYTIDPVGKIYKCGGFVGMDDFSVGNLHHDTFHYRLTEFMTTDLWRKCRGCPFIPLCAGGCRSSAFLKGSDFFQPVCEKRYFNQVAMPLIKEEYLRSNKGGEFDEDYQEGQ